MAAKSKSNEIKISRIYDAPVVAVWDAWTDPAQVAQWWGPRGFTITTHSKDLKPGGHWNYTMHGPDGTDYPNRTKYFEVEECRKLVYDHGANENQPPLFRVTVLFTEKSGKTHMDMSMTLSTPEAAEQTREFIKKAGGNATWDRLAEYLSKELDGKEKFVIARTFDAPIKTIYEMWTNPVHFTKWLPPTGMNMKFIRANIKVGETTFYEMEGNGIRMFGRAEYLELTSPTTLKYVQQFCDENENLSRHPLAPTFPPSMLTTVILTEESPDQTRVTITWEPKGNITQEELETFIIAKSGMTQGWTSSLDKLETLL